MMTVTSNDLALSETPWVRELDEALFAHYGVQIHSLIQLKTVLGIVAMDGRRYIWKSLSSPLRNRLWAVQRVSVHLKQFGFQLAAPLVGLRGELWTTLPGGRQGYLQPWLVGRHVDFGNRQERLSSLATVAFMHQQTPSHALAGGYPLLRTTLYDKIHYKFETLQTVWTDVAKALPEIQRAREFIFQSAHEVVASIDEFTQRHRPAIEAGEYFTFCHRDLAPHNLLWQDAQHVSMIDFDLAGLDDPFVDIMQIANHSIFLGEPLPGHFKDMVQVYGRLNKMSPERRLLLWNLLRFPDVFIRAAAEWTKAGYPESAKYKIHHALNKEKMRTKVWALDQVQD